MIMQSYLLGYLAMNLMNAKIQCCILEFKNILFLAGYECYLGNTPHTWSCFYILFYMACYGLSCGWGFENSLPLLDVFSWETKPHNGGIHNTTVTSAGGKENITM